MYKSNKVGFAVCLSITAAQIKLNKYKKPNLIKYLLFFN